MPAALSVPVEVQYIICSQDCLEIKDLARLARSSRVWYDVANSLVWEKLEGLDPLLKLLPEDAWSARYEPSPKHKYPFRVENYKAIRIDRNLQAKDWHHVMKLSCLVKELVLDWTRESASDFFGPFIAALVPETLTHLDMTALYHNRFSVPLIVPYCRSITHLYLNESFSRRGAEWDENYLLSIIKELHRCPRLTHVDMTLELDTNRKVFQALSECPALAKLSVELAFNYSATNGGWGWYGPPAYSGDRHTGFGALEVLELIGGPFCHATNIISADTERTRKMTHIYLTSDYAWEESSDLCDLTRAVGIHCNHDNLRGFHVSWADDGNGKDAEEWPLLFEHIAPLLAFPNLTAVSFTNFDGMTLTDDNCTQMARAWPQLRMVDFTPVGIQEADPLCTWEGFAAFARFCPDLYSVALPFNASAVPTSDPAPPIVAHSSRINILVFNYAPHQGRSRRRSIFQRCIPRKSCR
ncbi:hypothetical protein K523DRAFT_354180 [Schizophyllum commune Tattone D]|nr:hypothetical protein K523DRAFT_354180 [Schizophyllum commune Tattone D]